MKKTNRPISNKKQRGRHSPLKSENHDSDNLNRLEAAVLILDGHSITSEQGRAVTGLDSKDQSEFNRVMNVVESFKPKFTP